MVFNIYNLQKIDRVFFNTFFILNALLILIALFGLISGAGVSATLSGIAYLTLVTLLSMNKQFRKHGMSVIFCFFSLLYLNIPTAFVLAEGDAYLFGDGLASVPFEQEAYHDSLAGGFVLLSLLWLSMWLGIVSAGPRSQTVKNEYFLHINSRHLLGLGCVVLIVTLLDNQALADVRLLGEEKINSLLSFIFFDHAYLILAGLILFSKLNESADRRMLMSTCTVIFVVFAAFSLIHFLAGSKAAILVNFVLLVFIPYAHYKVYSVAIVSFPTARSLVIIVLLSFPLFYFALIQRIVLGSGDSPSFGTLWVGISEFDFDVLLDVIRQILYRLSWGGLDRFMLIYQSFYADGYDASTAITFVKYLIENTLNLVLPGTPFPDSYAPSSQLFPQVIQKNIVSGEFDRNTVIISSNTQPYTIFGIYIILFGLAAPFFLYLFVWGYVAIYKTVRNSVISIAMVYFFMAALSSYGIEVVFGNTVHLLVSIVLMLTLLRVFSQFNIATLAGFFFDSNLFQRSHPR